MKLSAKGDYACRALLELALQYPKERPVHVQEIAEKQNIPLQYLVQILILLKQTGLVKSRRGAEGGYFLAKSPDQITLGEVVRAIDGPLMPLKCLDNVVSDFCAFDGNCTFKPIWRDVSDAIAGVVDNITFEDICARLMNSRTAVSSD